MRSFLANYSIEITDYVITNCPEIFLALVCLINLKVISMSYFGSHQIFHLKYKFFSLRLVQFNIQMLLIVLFLYI